MIPQIVHSKLSLIPIEGREGLFRVKYFDPLKIYMSRYENRALPRKKHGYVRISGPNLTDLFFSVDDLEVMDLAFFKEAVLQELKLS